MQSIERTIKPLINEFLDEKLILLSGPRQVGKTYLSKSLTNKYQYFNFDFNEHKTQILAKTWERNGELVILDEIQKLKKWKQWIKGIYDVERNKNKFLLTGSSRMDTFKRMGDSLAGRHIAVRLNPLSLKEFKDPNHRQVAESMLRLGSFPEPFLSGSDRRAALWRKSHLDIILRHDLVQTESIRDIATIELLIELLKTRVGQQIVYKNLADELQISPITVKRWIDVLQSLFIVFVVHPYVKNVAEAVKKEPKIYFYDLGQVRADQGFKIENLAALHLLKRNQFLEDTEGIKTRLCYIRDKKKREIDFAITENNTLTHLIEVKKSEINFNSSLNYFAQRLRPRQSLQLVFDHKKNMDFETYQLRSLTEFLFNLES